MWESVLDLLPSDVHDRARLMTAVNSGEGLVKALLLLGPIDDGSTPARWVIEEFATVLRAKGREGSTIGQYIRLAYDGRPLQRNTASPDAGTVADPAVSFVAHITPQELRDEATRTDAASGFLNRFLVLPALKVDATPADPPPRLYQQAAARLAESARMARAHDGVVSQSEEAKRLLMAVKTWQADASSAPGMLGTMLERTSQHIHRMALVYSLSRLSSTNQTPLVEDTDVIAALAVADASERAVIELWSEAPGSPAQATILNRVRDSEPAGITPTELLHAHKHGYRDRMKSVIGSMLDQGLLAKRRVRGSRGYRLHVGQAVKRPSLWMSVAGAGTGPIAPQPAARDPKGVSPRGLGGTGLRSALADSPGTFETHLPPTSVDVPPIPPQAPPRAGGVGGAVDLA